MEAGAAVPAMLAVVTTDVVAVECSAVTVTTDDLRAGLVAEKMAVDWDGIADASASAMLAVVDCRTVVAVVMVELVVVVVSFGCAVGFDVAVLEPATGETCEVTAVAATPETFSPLSDAALLAAIIS